MSKPTLFQAGKLVGEGLENVIPIDYIVDWFRARVSRTGVENRVLVLKSETASGKSTVVPPTLFRAGVGSQSRGIIVTQPRVLTAISNVEEIRKHNKLSDREIGYSTKYDKLRPARNGILSATIGTLTMQLQSATDDEIARQYQYIMIDEAHERNVDLDLTVALLKKLLTRMNRRDDCPFLILASATFDPDEYLQYFGISRESNFIWCGGAPHPIDERWDYMGEHYSTKYITNITDIVMRISVEDKSDRSDVLVFLPGAGEIRDTADALTVANVGIVRKDPSAAFLLLKIDRGAVITDNRDHRLLKSTLDGVTQNIGGKQYKPRRRVILSTVVAETGLTLPDLKYVIDVGFSRENEYSPVLGASGLITKPAPQSRIRQRRGRAGRNAPGVFYPLYPRRLYDKLQPTQYPEIVTTNCTDFILRIIATQNRDRAANQYAIGDPDAFDPLDIDMVTKPPTDSLCAALRTLHNIGLMREMKLTALGKLAAAVPTLPPQHLRAILAAYYWAAPVGDVVIACCFVASGISASKINWWKVYRAAGMAATPTEYGALRLAICDQFIDGVVLYRALEAIVHDTVVEDFCTEIGADFERVSAFVENVDDTLSLMIQAELKIDNGSVGFGRAGINMRTVSAMKHCFYDGFSDNLLVLVSGERLYARVNNPRVKCKIPDILADTKTSRDETKTTGMAISVLPRYIITADINITSRNLAHELRATYISILDGFLSPDLHYGY